MYTFSLLRSYPLGSGPLSACLPRKYADEMEFLLDSYEESAALVYPSGARIQTAEGLQALIA